MKYLKAFEKYLHILDCVVYIALVVMLAIAIFNKDMDNVLILGVMAIIIKLGGVSDLAEKDTPKED